MELQIQHVTLTQQEICLVRVRSSIHVEIGPIPFYWSISSWTWQMSDPIKCQHHFFFWKNNNYSTGNSTDVLVYFFFPWVSVVLNKQLNVLFQSVTCKCRYIEEEKIKSMYYMTGVSAFNLTAFVWNISCPRQVTSQRLQFLNCQYGISKGPWIVSINISVQGII